MTLLETISQRKSHPLASKLGYSLIETADAYDAFLDANPDPETRPVFTPRNPFLPLNGESVVIDVTAADRDGAALLAELEALGLENGASYGAVVSGLLPLSAIREVALLETVQFARVSAAVSNVGDVTSQAVQGLKADDIMAMYGVDGSGVTVGILSDSYNTATTAVNQPNVPATDQNDDEQSGDLPDGPSDAVADGTQILDDSFVGNGSTSFPIDEGRAMAQLVFDIAPDSDLAFHTAFGGQAVFAQGILDLAAAGSDVIVDDVFYFAEPFFQDGIIAQAVDTVYAQGIPYFSSAGNSGRDSYEAVVGGDQTFINQTINGFTADWFDFDPGAGTDFLNEFTLTNGEAINISFQWDDPFLTHSPVGADTDLDFVVYEAGTSTPVATGVLDNIANGDPVEIIQFRNTTGVTQSYEIAIYRFAGPTPGRIKWVDFDEGSRDTEWATFSGTSTGHSSAEGALGVGAAAYFNTPEFGVDPAVLNNFSSAGGAPILFDTQGNPVTEIRDRVDITAIDGVNNTFFGNDSAADADAFGNFFGTSASAPNAAAIAALMLDLVPNATPDQIYEAMRMTAEDIVNRGAESSPSPLPVGLQTLPAGKDEDSGYGLLDGAAALDYLLENFDNVVTGDDNANTLSGEGGNDTLVGGAGTDELSGGTSPAVWDPVQISYSDFGINDGWTDQETFPRLLADLTMDGAAEIIGFGLFDTFVAESNGDGTFAAGQVGLNNFSAAQGWTSFNDTPRAVGDIDGDGASDIVGFGLNDTFSALANGDLTFAPAQVAINNYSQGQGWSSQDEFPRMLGDIDGDGNDDIIGFGAFDTLVSISNGDGTFQPFQVAIDNYAQAQGWATQDGFTRMVGDVDGDDDDDIIAFGAFDTLVSLSNGDGTFAPFQVGINNFSQAQGWTSQDALPRQIADVNGDGRDDIVGFGLFETFVSLSRGDGTFAPAQSGIIDYSQNQGWTDFDTLPRLLADLNGDEVDDLLGFTTDGPLVSLATPNFDSFEFNNGDEANTITDFEARNAGEKINLSGVSQITDYTDLMNNHLNDVGPDAVITDGLGLSITIENTMMSDLIEDNFLF